MSTLLNLTAKGQGTRKELSDALLLLAKDIFSDELEELYNIDGSSYNDNIIEVLLKDMEDEGDD